MPARFVQVSISLVFLLAGVILFTYATTRYWTTKHVSENAAQIVERYLVEHSLYVDLNKPESASGMDSDVFVESRSMLGRVRGSGGMYHWWNDALPFWGVGALLISVGCLLPAVRLRRALIPSPQPNQS